MRKLIVLLFITLSINTFAGQVDTILVHSAAMNKDIKCVVISPSGKGKWPVLYLLHGAGGSYAQWPSTAPQLKREADSLNILFVCPDGGIDSWYFDSPVDPKLRYETFVSKELVEYIDSHYPTLSDRSHRAITGLSMGGHGALYLAMHHKDLYGAAGATSGGVDFRPFPENWGIKKDLGEESSNQSVWDTHTVVYAADALQNGDLKIFFDCGVEDFFLTVNRSLHQKLLEKKIDHDYVERPGGHNGAYWRNSIDYQVLYFHKYFETSQPATASAH